LSEKDKSKPVTLADYIPPEPAPKPTRPATSKRDRDRLDKLDREMRDDAQSEQPARRKSGKKKSNLGKVVFYCILLVIIFKIVD
jgi:hypothetical protein